MTLYTNLYNIIHSIIILFEDVRRETYNGLGLMSFNFLHWTNATLHKVEYYHAGIIR